MVLARGLELDEGWGGLGWSDWELCCLCELLRTVEVLSWPLDWSGSAVREHGAGCTAVEADVALLR